MFRNRKERSPEPDARASSGTGPLSRDRHVLVAAVVVPLVFAVTLAAFAWPSARIEPRDLPLGLAGSAAATRPVEKQLAEHSGGAFDLRRYADAAAAREAIEDREIYGAVVVSSNGSRMLTSSAASPLVAGMLERALAQDASSGPGAEHPRALDVVPADEDDPRGAVLNSLVLPLVLSSVILAVMMVQLGRPGLVQASTLFAASALAGLVGITMVQGWLGALEGPWLVNAGVLSLTMLAVASFITGAAAWLGHGESGSELC
jgi:hypothetical protein